MQYKILITKTYQKKAVEFFKKHPDLLERYFKILTILENNPYHPSLRLHKLSGTLHEYYSVSINLEYRIIISFVINENTIIPIDIGTHDEIY